MPGVEVAHIGIDGEVRFLQRIELVESADVWVRGIVFFLTAGADYWEVRSVAPVALFFPVLGASALQKALDGIGEVVGGGWCAMSGRIIILPYGKGSVA
jgi:hypothetical protein